MFFADSAINGYTFVYDFNDCKLIFYSQKKSLEEIPEILTLFSFVILGKKNKMIPGKKINTVWIEFICGFVRFGSIIVKYMCLVMKYTMLTNDLSQFPHCVYNLLGTCK